MGKKESDEEMLQAIIKAMKVKNHLDDLEGDAKDIFEGLTKEHKLFLKGFLKEGKSFGKVARRELGEWGVAIFNNLLP